MKNLDRIEKKAMKKNIVAKKDKFNIIEFELQNYKIKGVK